MRALFTLALLSAACGGLPPAPTQLSDDPAFARAERVVPPGVAEDPPLALALLPGDTVTLQTVSLETTDYPGLIVDDLGHLHVPLVGDVDVGGRSLSEAEDRVEQQLRRFDNVVEVNIFITDAGGHRATVLGAVTTSGRVTIAPGTRLADLLAAAGGPLVEVEDGESVILADLDGARLVRDDVTMPVSLTLALQGDPRHNIRIQAGDHLYVPPNRGTRISVLGNVDGPRVIAWREGVRLTEALAMAGGVTIDGDRSDIRVIRGPLSAPVVYQTSFKALTRGNGRDVELAPGDVVYVTTHWFASLGEVINRLAPLISAGTAVGISYGVTAAANSGP